MTTSDVICPICGQHTFSYSNSYEICPVCDWENEEYQTSHPDEAGLSNEVSLNDFKAAWEKSRQPVTA